MNRNSKCIHALARKAFRNGALSFSVDSPTHGYHSDTKGRFIKREIVKCASVHKKKSKPFPTPNKDTTMTMTEQYEFCRAH